MRRHAAVTDAEHRQIRQRGEHVAVIQLRIAHTGDRTSLTSWKEHQIAKSHLAAEESIGRFGENEAFLKMLHCQPRPSASVPVNIPKNQQQQRTVMVERGVLISYSALPNTITCRFDSARIHCQFCESWIRRVCIQFGCTVVSFST